MSENIFSIVIPTCQRHDTLKYSIQSVINQTYKEFELVIMDNFSSLETAEVVVAFADDRIKYFRAPERLSMSENWELGLSYATGEYIFVLGDDDALMPDGLELCLKLIKEYNVKIVSWLRYSYGWPNAIVPWVRNRLYLNFSQVTEVWNCKEKLKDFYQYELSHEYLPMIYNSFINKDLIARIKSVYGRYFMSSTMSAAPDVYSGIVNAYFSDTYLYSFRAISMIGSSGHSIGASVCFQSLDSTPMQGFIKDEKKNVTIELHPNLVNSLNQEIGFAHVQICTKELFFPENREFNIDIYRLLNFVASSINRDPGKYDSILKDIEALAHKYKIPISKINIPAKVNNEHIYNKSAKKLEFYQGPILNSNGLVTQLIINCEEVGISNVSQAAMLARGILPNIQALQEKNQIIQEAEQQQNLQSKDRKIEQTAPKILLDGVFFQLYQTGIARVWRSLLEEWASNGFAKHIIILDRAGTAPKISSIQYLTVPHYDYGRTDADREILQQVCDEEGVDLFISSYYTTPISTPSVFVVHDMIPELMGWDLNHRMWREKHYGIQHASTYIAVSENTARDLVRFFPQISLESVTVAKNGVSHENFSPASPKDINLFKTKYGVSKPYFILVGIGGYKNTGLFFKAFAQLYTRHGFEVVCTGSGSILEAEFRNYTSGSVIHMLQLSDEELRAAYSGAVALVYPSKYEGFGLPVLEALACGCPVITCPNASIPEVAGEAALYVNDEDVDGLTDALCDVQKPNVRNSLIAAGLEQAKEFSWSKMAKMVSSALIDATLLPLNLKDINLIVFPDWSQPEESLCLELQRVIEAIATHPDSSQMTLLVDKGNIPDEGAALILSSVTMNILLQEDLDVTEGLEISLVGTLSEIQWEALLPRIHARIVLKKENKETLTQVKGENIPSYEIDSLSKLTSISV